MRELETKQRAKRAMYSTPVLLILVVLLVIFARGAWGALEKERESSEKVGVLQEKSLELETRRTDLEGSIVRLQTEEGMKEELRSKYNVTSEGEKFVVLVDDSPLEENEATSTRPKLLEWWNWLKNLLNYESRTK